MAIRVHSKIPLAHALYRSKCTQLPPARPSSSIKFVSCVVVVFVPRGFFPSLYPRLAFSSSFMYAQFDDSINRVARNNILKYLLLLLPRRRQSLQRSTPPPRRNLHRDVRHARRRTKKASVRKPRLRPPPCSSRCRLRNQHLHSTKLCCKRKATPLRKTPLKSCAPRMEPR